MVQDTDKYGRTVGRVYVGSLDVNAELVKRGAAWVYRQYSSDPSLITLEQQSEGGATRPVGTAGRATLCALGLAARNLQHRFGPTTHAPVASTAARAAGNSGFTCAGKRRCGNDLVSGSDVLFDTVRCQNRLDGDGDGRPCEKLCPLTSGSLPLGRLSSPTNRWPAASDHQKLDTANSVAWISRNTSAASLGDYLTTTKKAGAFVPFSAYLI